LCALFRQILPAGCDVGQVNYYIARVTPLPHDQTAPIRQDIYLRALRAHCGAALRICEGHFSVKKVRMPLASNSAQIVEVIKSEEKGSDVNLAVDLVNDAWCGKYECAAVVSNDADLARALKIAKQQLRKQIILCTPGHGSRTPLISLKRWSHQQLPIRPADLAASQMPNPVISGFHRISKPAGW
jgi:hypothetical protein